MTRARRFPATSARALSLSLLLLLSALTVLAVSPTAEAQVPPVPQPSNDSPHKAYKNISLEVNRTFVQVPYLGRAEVAVAVVDLSRDSLTQPGAPVGSAGGAQQDLIRVEVEFVGGAQGGWTAGSSLSAAALYGGERQEGTIFISTSGAVREPYVKINVTAILVLQDGTVITDQEQITAQVIPYYQGLIRVAPGGYPTDYIPPFTVIDVPIVVENTGLYIDAFRLEASAPEGFTVAVPPQVFVPPGETRIVNLTIRTPRDKVFDLGSHGSVVVSMRSANDPATVYAVFVGLQTKGVYVPTHWAPAALLGFLCVGLAVNRLSTRSELKDLEKGRPRPPTLTPRQRALLAELKRRDPAAYKERMAQLAAVYAARRAEYRSARREDARSERVEMLAARREAREERKRRKMERKLAKAAEKERRKEEAVLRAERAKRMKALAKERKRLEKDRAKAEKKRAKVEAKEAKRLAKLAAKKRKELDKLRKKAEKERKRAEKAARKKGGSSGP